MPLVRNETVRPAFGAHFGRYQTFRTRLTEAVKPVEPFDLCPFETACRSQQNKLAASATAPDDRHRLVQRGSSMIAPRKIEHD
jgi:hypothetical protein